jgi:hypothetical protein
MRKRHDNISQNGPKSDLDAGRNAQPSEERRRVHRREGRQECSHADVAKKAQIERACRRIWKSMTPLLVLVDNESRSPR